ncbi:MAG: tRNA threonylcarbamoyladenosine biosynthesis protein TsaB [Verrucomicrobiota bacterium]
MKILGFDLSTRQGSLALLDEDRLVTSREWPNDRRNSAPFFSALDEVFAEHSAPGMIVTGIGPGSYTGTRIAISAAIGLQATTGAALCGLPSIAALSPENEYIVIGDAKRSSFFLGHVRGGVLAKDIDLLSEPEIAARITRFTIPTFTSDNLPQFSSVKLRFPSAKLLCRQASRFPQNLIRAPLSPIYLREPHITSPRGQK